MNNEKLSAKDFCFDVSDINGDVSVVINHISSFEQDHHVDDSGEHENTIQELLDYGDGDFELLTDSTWGTGMDVEQTNEYLLECGFVELPAFTEFMKAHR